LERDREGFGGRKIKRKIDKSFTVEDIFFVGNDI
jgi:hypothetical protein